jgi:hypothetical protein
MNNNCNFESLLHFFLLEREVDSSDGERQRKKTYEGGRDCHWLGHMSTQRDFVRDLTSQLSVIKV